MIILKVSSNLIFVKITCYRSNINYVTFKIVFSNRTIVGKMQAQGCSFDPISKIWSGENKAYPYGNKSIGDATYEFMRNNLEHVAQVKIFFLKKCDGFQNKINFFCIDK